MDPMGIYIKLYIYSYIYSYIYIDNNIIYILRQVGIWVLLMIGEGHPTAWGYTWGGKNEDKYLWDYPRKLGRTLITLRAWCLVKALGHPSSVGCSNFQIHTCNTQNHHIITPFPICIMSGSSSIHTFTYMIYMYIHMITKAYHDIS